MGPARYLESERYTQKYKKAHRNNASLEMLRYNTGMCGHTNLILCCLNKNGLHMTPVAAPDNSAYGNESPLQSCNLIKARKFLGGCMTRILPKFISSLELGTTLV